MPEDGRVEGQALSQGCGRRPQRLCSPSSCPALLPSLYARLALHVGGLELQDGSTYMRGASRLSREQADAGACPASSASRVPLWNPALPFTSHPSPSAKQGSPPPSYDPDGIVSDAAQVCALAMCSGRVHHEVLSRELPLAGSCWPRCCPRCAVSDLNGHPPCRLTPGAQPRLRQPRPWWSGPRPARDDAGALRRRPGGQGHVSTAVPGGSSGAALAQHYRAPVSPPGFDANAAW